MNEAPRDVRLMCRVSNLTSDFRTHIGELLLPETNYCDMNGCRKLFESIDSQVVEIRTYAGKKRDTIYQKVDDVWKAFLPDEY